jgi:hypothetical protein
MRDTSSPRPVLEYEDGARFIESYLSGISIQLVDDTVLMSWRWARAGNETCVKFLNGAAHGFMTFDGRSIEVVREGWGILLSFLKSKL